MAQKINPLSLRLRKTNRNFDSSWFNDSNYVNLLMRDLKIQWYINLILKKLKYCSARYLVQNLPNKVKIHIFFCNPDKSRRRMSKIFYLNHTKKIKKSKKNFLNIAQTGISAKQNKIFQYLITSFNNNLVKTIENSECNILYDNNPINLSKNYLKLVSSIKKYNQFYLRYFLVKYFSIKFPTSVFNKKKHNFFSTSPTFGTSLHLTEDLFFGSWLPKNETQFKQQQNVLFFYIMGFLFFKVYKNKNFLALNYFQIKKNNYKIIKHDYENLFNKQLNKNNSSIKINLNNFSSAATFDKQLRKNQLNSSSNLSTIFFFNNLATTKLKILSFLKKLESKHKYVSSLTNFNKSSLKQINFKMSNKLHKNSILTLTNFIKLNENYKSLNWCDKKNNSINYSSSTATFNSLFLENKVEKSPVFSGLLPKIENKIIYTKLFYQLQNKKYYIISLMNNQNFNDIYNNYCRLCKSYKYYNNIFSNHNLNYYNNLNSSSNLIKTNKKLTLISSPYKYHMESVLCNSLSCNINFNFFQSTNVFQNAYFFIDEIIYYLERRVAFFKIKNYILKKLTEQKFLPIKGIRVTCSGRIGGKSKKAQRSRIQNFKYGETSLHVFSSKIDFKSKNAYTSFGTLGVKTWICYH